jgi:chemotaxis protein CheC
MKSLKLTPLEHDILTEVATIGAGHAVSPLSRMIGHPITIAVPELQLTQVEMVPELMGAADATTTVVLVKILGPAPGLILLLLDPGDAHRLVKDIAQGQETSAIEELTNILVGASLGALSRFLGLSFPQSVPVSTTDMLRAVVNEVLSELGAKSNQVLVLGITFTVPDLTVSGRLHFIFDPTATATILRAAQAKVEGANETTNDPR